MNENPIISYAILAIRDNRLLHEMLNSSEYLSLVQKESGEKQEVYLLLLETLEEHHKTLIKELEALLLNPTVTIQ